ncbi:phosphodiester glycosidase family protein [Candidatus Obscuribacterales bacterium]|nr:phosphodiester glycosidase family protein [Candidatus Obscuribacterales bacterium]
MSTTSSANGKRLELAKGVTYERVDIDDKARAHVVFVDTTRGAVAIKPYMSDSIETTSSAAAKNNAIVAINAGFFNLSDGESTSYITLGGKQLCEPKHNAALVNNEGLKPFLTNIFNRSELRFLIDKNSKVHMKVQAHSDAAPAGYRVVDSIQAGPQLLPKYTAREEAFVRRPPGAAKDADSIGTNMRAARTAFGITKNGQAVLVCVEGRKTKEFSEGISLPNLAEFMRRIGCESAINFDGGTSTTMVLSARPEIAAAIGVSKKTDTGNQSCDTLSTSQSASQTEGKSPQLVTVVASSPERRVKSIIYVTPIK